MWTEVRKVLAINECQLSISEIIFGIQTLDLNNFEAQFNVRLSTFQTSS